MFRIEALEQRHLLAITVDTTFDELDGSVNDGDVSLRDAIAAASTGETIIFDASLDGTTITLNRAALGQLTIDDSLTIDASNLTSLTIDADDPTAGHTGTGIRVIEIVDNSSGANPPLVTLIGLTLTGADTSGTGGAIQSAGRLIVRDCHIEQNEAETGGGIYVEVLGGGLTSREILRIENSTLSDNDAVRGGGIAVTSSGLDAIIITNGTIFERNGNSSTSQGGAIYAELYGASLTIDGGTSLQFNDADYGGAIHASLNEVASATLDSVDLTHNDATYGAGIYVTVGLGSTMHVEQVTFFDNEASEDGGGMHAYVLGESTLDIVNSVFSQNIAGNTGGGAFLATKGDWIITVSGVEFDHNEATNGGGAALRTSHDDTSAPSELRIENNTRFTNNIASYGGGLHTALSDGTAVVISGSQFQSNQAIPDSSGVSHGGALFADIETNVDAQLEIVDSVISENSANKGGGLFISTPYNPLGSANGSMIRLEQSLVESNHALQGGGIFTSVGSGGQVEIRESIITGNTAGETAPFYGALVPDSGGGIYALLFSDETSSRLTISGSEISNNTAGRHGGGITVSGRRQSSTSQTSEVSIYNTTISGNVAGHTTQANIGGTGGGAHFAVYPYAAEQALDVRFQNATVTGNTADAGGGIYSFVPTYTSARNDVRLTNSIAAGNREHAGTPDNLYGSLNITATKYDVIGSGNVVFDHVTHSQLPSSPDPFNDGTNVLTDSPLLSALGYFGGFTRSHELLPGSPAIDSGSNALAIMPFSNPATTLTVDQRGEGFSRIVDYEGAQPAAAIVDRGAIETSAPRVISVNISTDLTEHQNNNLDFPLYVVPDGGDQIRTIPVAKPNKLIVHFSKPMSAALLGDLTIEGRQFPGNTYTVVDVDTIGNVVTWTFSGPSNNAFYDQLRLTVLDSVNDTGGVFLDGDWTSPGNLSDPGDTFPSGDLSATGDFIFDVTIMPGDGNLDNNVDGSDFGIWNAHKFTSNCNFVDGDWNGDCAVDGSDFGIWNAIKFTDWSTFARPGDLEELRRVIDWLIARFGVLHQDGSVNHSASIVTWYAFANAVDRAFQDFNASGGSSSRPTTDESWDEVDSTALAAAFRGDLDVSSDS